MEKIKKDSNTKSQELLKEIGNINNELIKYKNGNIEKQGQDKKFNESVKEMERIMDQKLNEAVANIRLEFKKNLDDKIQDIEYSINNKVVTRLEMLERS